MTDLMQSIEAHRDEYVAHLVRLVQCDTHDIDHGIGGGNFAVGIVKRSYHCDDVREPRFGICARQFALAAAGTDKSYFERTVATFGTGKIDQSFKLLDAFQTAHGHVSAHARTSRRH